MLASDGHGVDDAGFVLLVVDQDDQFGDLGRPVWAEDEPAALVQVNLSNGVTESVSNVVFGHACLWADRLALTTTTTAAHNYCPLWGVGGSGAQRSGSCAVPSHAQRSR